MPQYDPARRRRGIRKGRERGAWIYIPAAELAAAGIEPGSPVPYYRLWSRKKRTVLIQLYPEP